MPPYQFLPDSNRCRRFEHPAYTPPWTSYCCTSYKASCHWSGLSATYMANMNKSSLALLQSNGWIWYLSSALSTLTYTAHHPEYPADYVPPEMDVFAEEEVPLGSHNSCPDVCTKESDRMERAFGSREYDISLREISGVPLALPLRVLGNISSGDVAAPF